MGLERLTLRDRERFGVKDYSETFSRIKPRNSDDYFSHIIGQQRTIDNLMIALRQDNVRAICNLGDRGVGKSACTKEVLRILEDLDNGTEKKSKYAEMLRPLHTRLKNIEKGDWIAFWNPGNITPHLQKLSTKENAASISSNININFYEWQEDLLHQLFLTAQRFGKQLSENQEDPWAVKEKFRQELYRDFQNKIVKIQQWSALQDPRFSSIQKKMVEDLQDPQYLNQLINGVTKRVSNTGEVSDIRTDHLVIQAEEGKCTLESLLTSHAYPYSNKHRVKIQHVMNPQYDELCPTVETESFDSPGHKRIRFGTFATNQVVVIDDNGKIVCEDKKLRNTLLPYLQDGVLRSEGKAQIEVNNPGLLIINDSSDPFWYQPFESRDPEPDWGMERRFVTIQYPSATIATDDIAQEMGRLITARADKYSMKITPETTNLIYHHILLEASEGLVPLTIGEFSPRLIDKPLLFAKNLGVEKLTPEILKEYWLTQRNIEAEHTVIQRDIKSFHRNDLDDKVGCIFGLAVYGDVPGMPGTPYRKSVNITNRSGEIFAPEWEAGLLDETYKKGVLTVQTFLEEHFGPIAIRAGVRQPLFEDSAGPSSSAAITYALMSAFGDIPINQRTFMTGTLQDEGEGLVGPIGAVFEKTRGAYHFAKALEARGIRDVFPITTMIPESNAGEFLRRLQFDSEIAAAIEKKDLNVCIHHTIWEGFEHLSGYNREEYTQQIREKIRERRERINEAEMNYWGMGIDTTF